MAEEQKQDQPQDGSKTLVSFVVGLLIGGMLVWAFSGSSAEEVAQDAMDAAADTAADAGDVIEAGADATGDAVGAIVDGAENVVEEVAATLPTGDGSITVNDQPAGFSVALEQATYPIEEGWIGVRDYNNGQLSFIKGVVQFSAAGGVVPENIVLQQPTVAGRDYAVVVFTQDGNAGFNPAGDVQLDEIFATFTAQ